MNRFFTSVLFLASVFSAINAQEYKMLEKKFVKHTGAVKTVAISHDGKTMLSGAEDKNMIWWDIATGVPRQILLGHFDAVASVLFTTDDLFMLSAGERTVRVYDNNGVFVKSFKGHSTYIWSMDVNASGKKMVTGSFEDKFKLWDLVANKVDMNFVGHTQSVLAVCFSPDGRFIASGSLDRSIKIWDAATYQLISTLSGHGDNIYDLEFSPDGAFLASCSRDKTIKLWEVSSGRIVRSFRGHIEAVMSIGFSPNGKYLLSASYDKTVRLWNATDGKELYIFNNHSDVVNAVDFAPDGFHFASAANNGELFYFLIDKRVFVDKYYAAEYTEEISTNKLFAPKKDSETKTEYKERQEKQEVARIMLYDKYYTKYEIWLSTQALAVPSEGVTSDTVKIYYK